MRTTLHHAYFIADFIEACASRKPKGASVRPAVRNRAASKRVGCGSMVVLSAEDVRNLKEAAGRRGYAVPRFNPRTGRMLTAQWRSWQKLQRNRLAEIEGSGEAEDLLITDAGKQALRQHNGRGEP